MDTLPHFEITYPTLYRTCTHLQRSFFYKNVFSILEQIPVNYALAEEMCSDALALCDNNWNEYLKKVDGLLDINMEFLTLQAQLERDRKYLYSSFEEVDREVFNKKDGHDTHGVSYLWGLYFTQIFWVTHHRLFNFFINEFVNKSGGVGTCLEVPVGSGVFLAHFLARKEEWSGVGVDLSASAIAMTQQLFEAKRITERSLVAQEDILKYKPNKTFDRIICGELLEHVEDPLGVLQAIHSLLSHDGKLFLTTVTWAAGVDHIYLYKNVSEIRNHISKSGFTIEKELIQNVFPKDVGKEEESCVALNYSAILVKRT